MFTKWLEERQRKAVWAQGEEKKDDEERMLNRGQDKLSFNPKIWGIDMFEWGSHS